MEQNNDFAVFVIGIALLVIVAYATLCLLVLNR